MNGLLDRLEVMNRRGWEDVFAVVPRLLFDEGDYVDLEEEIPEEFTKKMNFS